MHGTVIWNELNTRDAEKAKDHYGKLLGWTFETKTEHNNYIIASYEGRMVGGILDINPFPNPESIPPHWLTYFGVKDIDAALKTLTDEGGTILRPAFEVPEIGQIAIALDSVGACIGLMQPLDDQ